MKANSQLSSSPVSRGESVKSRGDKRGRDDSAVRFLVESRWKRKKIKRRGIRHVESRAVRAARFLRPSAAVTASRAHLAHRGYNQNHE